jgi:NTP pyrophosphatase (non-canonical NTP hydrolase)
MTSVPGDTIDVLRNSLREFARAREWERFHTPKNLAVSLGVELGELFETFQWRTDQEILDAVRGDGRPAIEDELADVFIYLVRLADVLDVDLLGVAERKMTANEARYPAAEVRGRADKQPRDR